MDESPLFAVSPLLAVHSAPVSLYQTGYIPFSTNTTGVPLYVYAIAVVVIISVASLAYHLSAQTEGKTEEKKQEGTPSREGDTEGVADEEGGEEEMSDDKRVLSMIESEGGRMKQKHVVEETGWSEAKVSKLTSRMEDDGRITKIRLGRENILETTDEKEDDNEEPPV